MKIRIFLALAVIVGMAGVASADIDALKDTVVRIATGASDGAGVIIGSDSASVYVMTAQHVIGESQDIVVKFNGARHRKFKADVVGTDDVDFAVLAVSVPSGDSVRDSLRQLAYRTGNVETGTEVSNIGHPAGELWEPNVGNRLQSSGANTLSFSKTGIAKGSSGGPLFDDEDRLIGIVIESSAANAKAVKMDVVLGLLRQWNVRTNLLGQGRRASLPPAPSAPPIDLDEGYEPEPEVAPQTGNVNMAYTGDLMGCNLQLAINLGGVQFNPTSNPYLMRGVPLGAVPYTISGRITCLHGTCNAYGMGNLNLNNGDTVYVGWMNVAYGTCAVTLRTNQ